MPDNIPFGKLGVERLQRAGCTWATIKIEGNVASAHNSFPHFRAFEPLLGVDETGWHNPLRTEVTFVTKIKMQKILVILQHY
jgi:hypothetical protein